MIAVDTNILVYAHRIDGPFHEAAAGVMRGLCEGTASWALPWPCLHEFLAIVTNARIFATPTPTDRARAQLAAWLAAPTLRTLAEGDGYASALDRVLAASQVTGGRVHDARIAALCLFHRVGRLWTADRDFSRFPGLRTENPLVR
jgi:uncharacterized protein